MIEIAEDASKSLSQGLVEHFIAYYCISRESE